jgi:hypothetical protein
MYVAVTRAVESLTIFRTHPKDSLSSARIMWEASESAAADDPGCCTVTELDTELPVPPAPVRTTATGVTVPAPADQDDLYPATIGRPEDSREIRLGSAVHAIMEKIDFADPAGWLAGHDVELSRGWQDLSVEAGELALAFFDMDLPVSLPGCRIVGREYSYVVETPAGPRTRYVDLLLDTGDSLVVMDYKTDHAPGGDLAVAAAEYTEKQEFYMTDLAEAFRRPVTGYLVFLRERAFFEVGSSG